MSKVSPKIEQSWKNLLKDEFHKEYFSSLKDFLLEERDSYQIFPPAGKIFAAFNNCPFDILKVVIIWQDPYHWPGQANGLCFSVNPWVAKPPSLQNIYKEIQNDLSVDMSESGDLSKWPQQWVLLLNATLTVRKWQAGSHKWQWWEQFTNNVINLISQHKEWVVFLLWWNYAKEKKELIDTSKHYVLEAAHPSPFSAYKWFFGCKHFSKTNEILEQQNKTPIQWQV